MSSSVLLSTTAYLVQSLSYGTWQLLTRVYFCSSSPLWLVSLFGVASALALALPSILANIRLTRLSAQSRTGGQNKSRDKCARATSSAKATSSPSSSSNAKKTLKATLRNRRLTVSVLATFAKLMNTVKRRKQDQDGDYESRVMLARDIEAGVLGRKVTWGELPPGAGIKRKMLLKMRTQQTVRDKRNRRRNRRRKERAKAKSRETHNGILLTPSASPAPCRDDFCNKMETCNNTEVSDEVIEKEEEEEDHKENLTEGRVNLHETLETEEREPKVVEEVLVAKERNNFSKEASDESESADAERETVPEEPMQESKSGQPDHPMLEPKSVDVTCNGRPRQIQADFTDERRSEKGLCPV